MVRLSPLDAQSFARLVLRFFDLCFSDAAKTSHTPRRCVHNLLKNKIVKTYFTGGEMLTAHHLCSTEFPPTSHHLFTKPLVNAAFSWQLRQVKPCKNLSNSLPTCAIAVGVVAWNSPFCEL